jgi:hypothetical protein
MPFEVSVDKNDTYVLVRVTGAFSRQVAVEIAKAASERGRATNLKAYLYDVREAPNVESPVSNYDFANSDMPALRLDRTARVAILTAPGDRSHAFPETVVRNAGYGVRLFTDGSEAIAWLLGAGAR